MILDNKKIIFICGAKRSYVRNNIIFKLLSSKNQVKKITSEANYYFLRLPIILIKFLICPKKDIDFIFVGFLAQPLVICLSYLTKKPIVSDMFISLYDTLCYDRKKVKPNSLLGKIIFKVDKTSIDKSHLIITDTKTHSQYFHTTFNTPNSKIQHFYLGAEIDIFYPQEKINKPNNNLTVFYYGTALPLHGTEIILKTIKLLEKEKINFVIIGPIQKNFKDLIKKLKLSNVDFINWVPYDKLPKYISQADICLGGPFGSSDKASRVIAGKTYQFIAMKKPVILGDSEGNKELFTNEENCLLVPRNDESALTNAILKLKNNPNLRDKIGEKAHRTINDLQQLINF